MNTDLIVKLARLANENPNENEANAAARKVCKLIKEGSYSFSAKQPPGMPQNQYSGGFRSPFEDVVWNAYNRTRHAANAEEQRRKADEQKREEERIEREKYQREQHAREEEYKKERAQERYKGQASWINNETRKETFDWLRDFAKRQTVSETKPKKPKHMLECRQCRLSFETTFNGKPELFVCSVCQWQTYNEGR